MHLNRWEPKVSNEAIDETLQPDFSYRLRQRFDPLITRLVQTVGQPEYRLRNTEYVSTVQQPLDEFTEMLQEHGYAWNPLAWYHLPPVGLEPDGSWTYQRTLLADRQIHTILIAHSPEYIDIFTHEEYNWLRHPIKHFRQIGIERKAGSRDMRRWIESHGIEVDTRSPQRRQIAHAINDLCKYLGFIVQ